ncbi:subclass B3 metallo-beta-lactamase [Thermomonas sp. HDW16]|uniref:subclass B3 metallo-beta-lactamase n=1 Tax=Thermomonas sp. HDW16 TaxID=2714945 RepID=UPI0014081E2A|nr:subclass B3 metallo-beta-lactamase [Thermomonas sp. HDW16]QIL20717.1 subclass B3 metallo-beta-lactamase [Thermomonas sp. HDW16]
MRLRASIPLLAACGMLVACAAPKSIDTATVATLATIAPTACAEDASWSDPTSPRKVFGTTWFVGTCSISAILITSPEGHILIDAATEQAAPSIEANIRAAGFRVEDIKTILVTHEHNDHVGGVAQLQRDSGARVLARTAAADALKTGRSDRRDPQFETIESFPPVANVGVLVDGDEVTLGTLRMHHLPNTGHTAGGSGWAWRSCEGTTCRDIVFPDSNSAISDKTFRYSDHPEHVAAFRRSMALIAAQPCDILITTHVQSSDLLQRLDGKRPLVDAGACKAYAAQGLANLETRLAKEAAGELP